MTAARILGAVLIALVVGVTRTSGAIADQTPTPVIASAPAAVTSSTSATFTFTDDDLAAASGRAVWRLSLCSLQRPLLHSAAVRRSAALSARTKTLVMTSRTSAIAHAVPIW